MGRRLALHGFVEAAQRVRPDLVELGRLEPELERAAQFLTRAYASFPDPEVAAHLGEVMWMMGNNAAATRVWEGALRKDPQHVVLNETLQRLGISLQAEAPGDTSATER